jgi:hypothetical protein
MSRDGIVRLDGKASTKPIVKQGISRDSIINPNTIPGFINCMHVSTYKTDYFTVITPYSENTRSVTAAASKKIDPMSVYFDTATPITNKYNDYVPEPVLSKIVSKRENGFV